MFTDDDLTRLKDHIDACSHNCQTCAEMKLKALTDRLDSADRIIDQLKPAGHWYVYGSSPSELKAYRVAAGKS